MHLLVVCTGNICRSPLGERITRTFAAEALGARAGELTASSAGTGAVVGAAMDRDAAAVLVGLGGDPSGFTARRFTPDLTDGADLVLTMEVGHRTAVLDRAPRALRRTFTLREAAAVLQLLPAAELPTSDDVGERGRQLVAALGRHRADWQGSNGATDVRDPYRRPREVHEQVGEVIVAALLPLLRAIAGTGPRD